MKKINRIDQYSDIIDRIQYLSTIAREVKKDSITLSDKLLFDRIAQKFEKIRDELRLSFFDAEDVIRFIENKKSGD